MSEAETKPAGRGPGGLRFNGEINLGTVLIVATALIGVISYEVTTANRGEQLSRDQIALQASLAEKIADLRSTVQAGQLDLRQQIQDMRQQIGILPDQRAKLENTERVLTDIESRLNSGDARLSLLERAAIESRADLNQIMRATNGPLPPRGR
jgi:TolA-binding protein